MTCIRVGFTFLTVFGLAACATKAAEGGGAQTGEARVTQDRTTLTAANLAEHARRQLYDVIRQERPHWLSSRGATTLTQNEGSVVVYRDGVRLGGPEYLRDITADVVHSVQYLSGPEASTRFGLNHQHGAILVVTRKR